MFIYQSRHLTRGEVWYDEAPNGNRVDWIYHRQRSSPVAGARCAPCYTRLVDLRKTPADLLAGMETDTARKITEAREKDRLQWERFDSKDAKVLNEVERMWNEHANATKTHLFERDWMDQIRKAGCLDISAAINPAGDLLVYHLVLATPRRARQLIAISPHRAVPDVAWRNMVNRAHCFLHWKNFLRFKEAGIPCFDFGGWYTGTTNIQFLGMNRFKQGFGGQVVREYECEEIRTFKGWLALTGARILKRTGLFDKVSTFKIGLPQERKPLLAGTDQKPCQTHPRLST
jgi:hypothetical protein